MAEQASSTSKAGRGKRAVLAAQTAATFFPALAVYLLTCARTVTSDDSGELILASATLGVPHPPGFPLYTLIGHLFSKLPVGSVAFRLNLMSAFFAAAAAVFVALLVAELQAEEAGTSRTKTKKPSSRKRKSFWTAASTWLPRAVPVSGGLAFAFSLTVWSYATHAEVYTLTLALLAGALYLLVLWGRQARDLSKGSAGRRMVPLLLAGLVLGLALGVHHSTVLLALPAFGLFLIRAGGWRTLRSRELLGAAAALALGLSVYLYLPLAAARSPVLNWGDPSTGRDLWTHVSARLYQGYLFEGSVADVPAKLLDFRSLLVQQSTVLGLVLAFFGLLRIWRRHRDLAWTLLVLVACGLGYAMVYYPSENRDAYYLSTFLVVGLFCAAGLQQLWGFSARRSSAWRLAAVLLVLLLPAVNLWVHYRRNDRSQDRVARHYVEDTLAGVGRGALVMTRDWQLSSPYLYLRHVERLRPDVTLVDAAATWYSWYVDYLGDNHPRMMASCDQERHDYVGLLRRFELGEGGDRRRLDRLRLEFLECLLESFLPGGEAHVTLDRESAVGSGYQAVPSGLTFRLYPGRPLALEEPPPLHLEPLLADAPYLDEVARRRIRPTYGAMLALRAAYLIQRREPEDAKESLRLAVELAPENRVVQAVNQSASRFFEGR
jgi:hypothetical protein